MLKINPYIQSESYCGPASLKMVLDYYGIQKTEEEIARLSGCTREEGVSPEGLLDAARKQGLAGYIKEDSEFDELRRLVNDQGIPVIVDWFSGDDGHYSVVSGIDQENVFLQDPMHAEAQVMGIGIFRRLWFDFDGDHMKSKKDLRLRLMIVLFPEKYK